MFKVTQNHQRDLLTNGRSQDSFIKRFIGSSEVGSYTDGQDTYINANMFSIDCSQDSDRVVIREAPQDIIRRKSLGDHHISSIDDSMRMAPPSVSSAVLKNRPNQMQEIKIISGNKV